MSRPAVGLPGAVLKHPAFGRPPVHNEVRPGRRKGILSLNSARRARRERDEAASRAANATRVPLPDAMQSEVTLQVAQIAMRALTVFQSSETQAARFNVGDAVLARFSDGTLQPVVVVSDYSVISYSGSDGAGPRVGYVVELDGGRRAFAPAGALLDLAGCTRHLRFVGARS